MEPFGLLGRLPLVNSTHDSLHVNVVNLLVFNPSVLSTFTHFLQSSLLSHRTVNMNNLPFFASTKILLMSAPTILATSDGGDPKDFQKVKVVEDTNPVSEYDKTQENITPIGIRNQPNSVIVFLLIHVSLYFTAGGLTRLLKNPILHSVPDFFHSECG